jgi:hypothetical protein
LISKHEEGEKWEFKMGFIIIIHIIRENLSWLLEQFQSSVHYHMHLPLMDGRWKEGRGIRIEHNSLFQECATLLESRRKQTTHTDRVIRLWWTHLHE